MKDRRDSMHHTSPSRMNDAKHNCERGDKAMDAYAIVDLHDAASVSALYTCENIARHALAQFDRIMAS